MASSGSSASVPTCSSLISRKAEATICVSSGDASSTFAAVNPCADSVPYTKCHRAACHLDLRDEQAESPFMQRAKMDQQEIEYRQVGRGDDLTSARAGI